jgi:hypothetical protein
MAAHLYALFRFSHLVTRTQPSQLYVKTLVDEFSRAKLGKYELVTHRDDAERTQVVFTRLPNPRLPPFLECFTRIRSAAIHWQEQQDVPLELKSCTLLITPDGLGERNLASPGTFPPWVLEEFPNCLLIDERLPTHQSDLEGIQFEHLELRDCPPVLKYFIEDGLPEKSRQLGLDAAIRFLANTAHLVTDDTPITLTVQCASSEDLYELASRVYAHAPDGEHGVGGRALLTSFCLEQNRDRIGTEVKIANAAALGLQFRHDSGDLIDRVLVSKIKIKSVVGRS